jgi:DNA-binding PadR family transcriptional regulator
MYIVIWLYSHMAIDIARSDPLSDAFHALSDPTISKHLKVLERAGLIEGGRDAQRRPRKLAPLAMKDIADWIEPFRRQWEKRLDNLDAHLAKLKEQEKANADSNTGLRRDRPRNRS